MTRTQIQLPDHIYEKARVVCHQREISLAELARRGIEYMLSVYSEDDAAADDWQPPKPRKLGWRGLTDAEIKRESRVSSGELSLVRRKRK